jgi:hypothetical protein
MIKKIYSANIIYRVEYEKTSWLGVVEQYEGEVIVPVDQYIFAFSKENAKNLVVYSTLWDTSIAEEIMWQRHRALNINVRQKHVEIEEVVLDDIADLKMNMNQQDFSEWLQQCFA